MPTYEGSPFGIIHGSIGDVTAKAWKGIPMMTSKSSPTDANTIKQQATRNVLTIFSKIIKEHLNDLIRPIWEPYADRMGLPMTGGNWFMKTSMRKVKNTTRDGTQDPDYSQIQLASGHTEPSPGISDVTYNYDTGLLTITWDPATYGMGRASDMTFLAAISKDGSVWLGSPGARSLGSGVLSIPPETDPMDLNSFVFFNQGCHYSQVVVRPILNAVDEVFGDDETTRITSSTTYEDILTFKWTAPTEMTALEWYAEIKNASAYLADTTATTTLSISNPSNEYIEKRAGARAAGTDTYQQIRVRMKALNGAKGRMKSIHVLALAQ